MTTTSNFFDTRTRNWRARLAISVDVMRELSRYSDPREMYQVFSERMAQLFPTSRQIMLSRRGVEEPFVRITRFNLWSEPIDPFSPGRNHPIHESELFSELLYADEPRVIDDLTVGAADPATGYLDGQQSLLSIPIFEHGKAQHTVVLTREESAAFPPEQVPELVWLTNLFGRATQTLVLSQALRHANEESESERRAIAELQQSLLPLETPRPPGLTLACHYSTAHRAGGDYYDFFPQPEGRLGVLIADVSGHGTPAAVLMAIAHSIAHAGDAPTGNPGAFLTHLNRHLAGRYNRSSGSFITAFYAVVDPVEHTLTYASAGHLPPRFVKADGTLLSLNRVQRLPLGISPADEVYPEYVMPFTAGERVAMVTDGVTEAVDASGAVFGTDRLNESLLPAGNSATESLIGLLNHLNAFTDNAPQTDDRTVVVLQACA